jgi:hypothetical protein
MPQPDVEPVTLPAVKAYLSLDDERDDTRLAPVLAAVTVFLRRTEKARRVGLADPAAVWPADLVHGGVMLAARLHRRRNSTTGVEAFAAAGPVYVRRNDPDIAMMLDLDAPMVG